MLSQQQILLNTEIIQHLLDAAKVVGPFVATIVALVVYVWTRLEKTQQKLEQTLIEHIRENDATHDKVFDEIRTVRHELDVLNGEHKGMKFNKATQEAYRHANNPIHRDPRSGVSTN
jgi:hypothetical protein